MTSIIFFCSKNFEYILAREKWGEKHYKCLNNFEVKLRDLIQS